MGNRRPPVIIQEVDLSERVPVDNGIGFDTIIIDDPLADLPEHTSSPNGCTEDCPRCELERVQSRQRQAMDDLGQRHNSDMLDALQASQVFIGNMGRPVVENILAAPRMRLTPTGEPARPPAREELIRGAFSDRISRLSGGQRAELRTAAFGLLYGMSPEQIRAQIERITGLNDEQRAELLSSPPPADQFAQAVQNMAGAFGIDAQAAAERLGQAVRDGAPPSPIVITSEQVAEAFSRNQNSENIITRWNQDRVRVSPMFLDTEGASSPEVNRIFAPPQHHNARSRNVRLRSPDERYGLGDVVLVRDIYTDGVQHSKVIAAIGERDIMFGFGFPYTNEGELVFSQDGMPLLAVNGVLMPVMRVVEPPSDFLVEVGDEITVELPQAEGLRRTLEVSSIRQDREVRLGSRSTLEGELAFNPSTNQIFVGVGGSFIEIRDSSQIHRPETDMMQFVGADFSQGEARTVPNYGDLEANIVAQMARRIAQETAATILNPDGTPLLTPRPPPQIHLPAYSTMSDREAGELNTKKNGVQFKSESEFETTLNRTTNGQNIMLTLEASVDREAVQDPHKMAQTIGELATAFILKLFEREGILPSTQVKALELPELGVRKITKENEEPV